MRETLGRGEGKAVAVRGGGDCRIRDDGLASDTILHSMSWNIFAWRPRCETWIRPALLTEGARLANCSFRAKLTWP